jgi:uncharacterized membrane protein YoaK (UPF0700 family)
MTDLVVLLLTWAAGTSDALCFLRLHVFPANMTGNTMLLGLAIGRGEFETALRSAVALAGFLLGVAAGTLIVGRAGERGGWSPAVTRVVMLEWGLLALLGVTWSVAGLEPREAVVHVLVVLSSLAMGMQSAAVFHVRIPGVATTYITGTLTSLMVGLVGRLRQAAVKEASSPSPETDRSHAVRIQGSLFVTYALAAVVCGAVELYWPFAVSLLPLAALTAAFTVAMVWLRREGVGSN